MRLPPNLMGYRPPEPPPPPIFVNLVNGQRAQIITNCGEKPVSVLGPSVKPTTHRCSAPWSSERVLNSRPTPFGVNKETEVRCSCGEEYMISEDWTPFGVKESMSKRKRKAVVTVDPYTGNLREEYLETGNWLLQEPSDSKGTLLPAVISLDDALAKVKECGWEILESGVMSPLELPPGQMMVDADKWEKRQAEIEKWKKAVSMYRWCGGFGIGMIIAEILTLLFRGAH